MADWRTYAKAAKRTAQKQAPGARDAILRGVDRGVQDAKVHARAAARTADKSTREFRDDARRTAAATAVVTKRRYDTANLGTRLKHGARDAFLMAAAIGVIWAVVSRVAPIPWQAVVAVILFIVVLRMGWALVAGTRSRAELDEDAAEAQAIIRDELR